MHQHGLVSIVFYCRLEREAYSRQTTQEGIKLATCNKPIIGSWYINPDGQFAKVWGVVYENGRLNKIVIQQLSGKRFCIKLENWQSLELALYPLAPEQLSGSYSV